MPNLVGIGLSQVPTNSMLGGLAYQDPEHASIKDLDLKNLSQINSEIADTATDIFVYDTRKDSDGGAWRKRTQHTSWYNETLGTATRGTRKEFPAVAVIVAEIEKLTIYDGDDPDLPMWMVFLSPSSTPYSLIPNVAGDIISIAALNGKITLGYHTNYGIGVWDFISEFCINTWRENSRMRYPGSIAERNDQKGSLQLGAPYILDYRGRDVAMTVLPNAPIDDATRLPVPTIAVGTGSAGAANGGVSVIKDDGTVVDIKANTGAGGYATYNVEFGSNNELIHTQAYNNSYASVNIFDDIPSSDVSASNSYSAARSYLYINGVPDLRGGVNGASTPNLEYVSKSSNGDIAFGFQNTDAKLSLLSEPKNVGTSNQYSAVAYITSDYNTGWMHGHIKGAFLSDTTAESLSATNLVSEDFSANWTGATNGVISVSSGQLTITNSGGGNGRAVSNTFATTGGKKYAFIVKAVSNSSATYRLEVRGPELVTTGTTNGQKLVVYFNGTGNSSTFVELYAIGGSGASATYEDAYVVEIEEDRSVNNNGLQVFGTVPKQVVATGADLVGYGPFDNSSYLRQPYNSDLQWDGSSTWSISFWVYFTQNQAYDTLISREQSGGSGNRWSIQTGNQNTITFKSQGSSRVDVPGDSVYGQWRHICFIQEGGLYRSYRDGVEVGTYVGSDNFSNTSAELNIGYETSVGGAEQSKLALVRISNTPPSPEQIKKMYEDEKMLFQENAKATLYGSSDAITGLAHDDSTDSLHVGTSAGRSEFQGLCRINNTTTAVTTAISASNGLVAEQ